MPMAQAPPTRPVAVATIVVASFAALLQVLGAIADVALPLLLLAAPPEGLHGFVVTDDDLVPLLRELDVRGLVVAACAAAIAIAVRGRTRATTPALRGALGVSVVALTLSVSQWPLELG